MELGLLKQVPVLNGKKMTVRLNFMKDIIKNADKLAYF